MKKASFIPSSPPMRESVVMVAVSPSELAWLEILRLLMDDDVPAPSLARIQALRKAMSPRKSD